MTRSSQIAELNLAIDELLEILEQELQSGEELPEELLDQIADELSAAADKIAELEITPEPFEREEDEPSSVPTSMAPPLGSDLLWILSGANPQLFSEYLQTFPDKNLNNLAKNTNQLKSLIQRLQNDVSLPVGEVSEGIPKSDIQSSNVYGFQYSPGSKILKVKFQGNGASGAGPIYQYEGVPPQIFKMFRSASQLAKTSGSNKWGSWWVGKPSMGASFHQLIKQAGYPYKRLS